MNTLIAQIGNSVSFIQKHINHLFAGRSLFMLVLLLLLMLLEALRGVYCCCLKETLLLFGVCHLAKRDQSETVDPVVHVLEGLRCQQVKLFASSHLYDDEKDDDDDDADDDKS